MKGANVLLFFVYLPQNLHIMKKLLLILLATTIFLGCSKDDEEFNPVKGEWIEEGSSGECNYVFSDDFTLKSCYYNVSNESFFYNYTIDKTHIRFNEEYMGVMEFKYEIKKEDKTTCLYLSGVNIYSEEGIETTLKLIKVK